MKYIKVDDVVALGVPRWLAVRILKAVADAGVGTFRKGRGPRWPSRLQV